jgi:hypothetical protein
MGKEEVGRQIIPKEPITMAKPTKRVSHPAYLEVREPDGSTAFYNTH